jgi:hypothetical protein
VKSVESGSLELFVPKVSLGNMKLSPDFPTKEDNVVIGQPFALAII